MTGSPFLTPGDALPDLLDPAGVLVPHDVGEIDVDLAAPNALDNVQIGAADAGAADAHDDVCGANLQMPRRSSYLTNSLAVNVSS